jgi:LysR family transcriptional regulator for metE and metH
MDLEVRHLRLVQAVAAVGGLTRAGRALHLTQSALSHQLRQVEEKLGTPLFLRVGKRMVLTNAGEELLRAANDVLARLEITERAIREAGDGTQGRLRVSTGCYTDYHWLPRVLVAFREVCPAVDVHIVAGDSADPVAGVLGGHLDVAVVARVIDDARLSVTPLFEDDLVLIVPRDHPLGRRRAIAAGDLASETLLLAAPPEESVVFQRLFGGGVGAPAKVQRVAQTNAIVELVRSRWGVAVLARWAVDPYARAGTIRAVPLAFGNSRLRWSAVVARDFAQVSYVREFLSLLTRLVPPRRPGGGRASTARLP